MNHRTVDFKRLIAEKEESKDKKAFVLGLSKYEVALISTNKFLENIVDDSAIFLSKRFDGFNDSQSKAWQSNIPKHSFVEIFVAFERFCELMYLREKPNTADLNDLFRKFREGESLINEIFKASYVDWLSPTDYSKLERYFNKYNLISDTQNKGRVLYFDFENSTEEEREKRIVTIEEVLDLIRIILILKDKMSKISSL